MTDISPLPRPPQHYNQAGGGWRRQQDHRRSGEGQDNVQSCRRPDLGASQQLHPEGDAIVPGHGQDAHETGHEGRLEHVPLVGVIVKVAWEDLGAEKVSGRPPGAGPPHPTPQSHGGPTHRVARGAGSRHSPCCCQPLGPYTRSISDRRYCGPPCRLPRTGCCRSLGPLA